jgi:hypothetical protein
VYFQITSDFGSKSKKAAANRTVDKNFKKSSLGDGKTSGGIVGFFKKNRLQVYSVGTFYRAFIVQNDVVTELQSDNLIPVQEHNVLFLVPEGITKEAIQGCLALEPDEKVNFLVNKLQELRELNGEVIIATIE